MKMIKYFQGSLGSHHNPATHPALASHQFVSSPLEDEKKPLAGNSPGESNFLQSQVQVFNASQLFTELWHRVSSYWYWLFKDCAVQLAFAQCCAYRNSSPFSIRKPFLQVSRSHSMSCHLLLLLLRDRFKLQVSERGHQLNQGHPCYLVQILKAGYNQYDLICRIYFTVAVVQPSFTLPT